MNLFFCMILDTVAECRRRDMRFPIHRSISGIQTATDHISVWQ